MTWRHTALAAAFGRAGPVDVARGPVVGLLDAAVAVALAEVDVAAAVAGRQVGAIVARGGAVGAGLAWCRMKAVSHAGERFCEAGLGDTGRHTSLVSAHGT